MRLGELIKRAWDNKHLILQGVINRIASPKHIKKLAKDRLKVCNACPLHSKNHKTSLPYKHCTACGCSLGIKPYAENSKCPKGKW